MNETIRPGPGRQGAGRRKTTAPKLPRITPVEGISIERQVYQTLRYAFMSGAVRPGEGLTSRSLSAALGISPTPVREALKRLEGDGALVSRNKSAFFVYEPDQAAFSELFDIRLTLEGHATRAAAQNARPENLVALHRINDEYMRELESGDKPGASALAMNFRFHFEVYRLSGSAILVEMIETLWLRIGPTLQHYTPGPGDGGAFRIYHGELLEALGRNDPADAEQALRKDLTAAYRALLPRLRKGDDGPGNR